MDGEQKRGGVKVNVTLPPKSNGWKGKSQGLVMVQMSSNDFVVFEGGEFSSSMLLILRSSRDMFEMLEFVDVIFLQKLSKSSWQVLLK